MVKLILHFAASTQFTLLSAQTIFSLVETYKVLISQRGWSAFWYTHCCHKKDVFIAYSSFCDQEWHFPRVLIENDTQFETGVKIKRMSSAENLSCIFNFSERTGAEPSSQKVLFAKKYWSCKAKKELWSCKQLNSRTFSSCAVHIYIVLQRVAV